MRIWEIPVAECQSLVALLEFDSIYLVNKLVEDYEDERFFYTKRESPRPCIQPVFIFCDEELGDYVGLMSKNPIQSQPVVYEKEVLD